MDGGVRQPQSAVSDSLHPDGSVACADDASGGRLPACWLSMQLLQFEEDDRHWAEQQKRRQQKEGQIEPVRATPQPLTTTATAPPPSAAAAASAASPAADDGMEEEDGGDQRNTQPVRSWTQASREQAWTAALQAALYNGDCSAHYASGEKIKYGKAKLLGLVCNLPPCNRQPPRQRTIIHRGARDWASHMQDCHPPAGSKAAMELALTQQLMDAGHAERLADGSFRCLMDSCNTSFQHQSLLLTHTATHLPSDHPLVQHYAAKCIECSRVFRCVSDRDVHMRMVHGTDQSVPAAASFRGRKRKAEGEDTAAAAAAASASQKRGCNSNAAADDSREEVAGEPRTAHPVRRSNLTTPEEQLRLQIALSLGACSDHYANGKIINFSKAKLRGLICNLPPCDANPAEQRAVIGKRAKDWASHLRRHHPSITGESKSQKAQKESALTQQLLDDAHALRLADGSFRCLTASCGGKEFKKQSAFLRHAAKHLPADHALVQHHTVQCTECGQQFRRARSLPGHMARQHGAQAAHPASLEREGPAEDSADSSGSGE